MQAMVEWFDPKGPFVPSPLSRLARLLKRAGNWEVQLVLGLDGYTIIVRCWLDGGVSQVEFMATLGIGWVANDAD